MHCMRASRFTKQTAEPIPCGYCFQEWATGYDHLLPFSYREDNRDSNLYPCCKRCNLLLSNKMFTTITEKREYVRTKLIAKGCWNLPALPEGVSQESASPEILQFYLPMGTMEPNSSTHTHCYICRKPFPPGKIRAKSLTCGRACSKERKRRRDASKPRKVDSGSV